jgi:rod shape-determining protein MreB
MVCVPTNATDVEERAVRQATLQSGARQAVLIEEPLAAAMGAGINIDNARGNMVVDIGGGTTDIAVLSLGDIVVRNSLRVGGDKFDEAIIRYIRREYNLLIGERTAEDLKMCIGTAYPLNRNENEYMEIRGRDLMTGLPKTIRVTARESWLAIQEPVEQVVNAVKEVLEKTPPELAADILDSGIVMTGGGSMLDGFNTLLSKRTNLPIHLAEHPISCVALGTGRALQNLNVYSKRPGYKRVL